MTRTHFILSLLRQSLAAIVRLRSEKGGHFGACKSLLTGQRADCNCSWEASGRVMDVLNPFVTENCRTEQLAAAEKGKIVRRATWRQSKPEMQLVSLFGGIEGFRMLLEDGHITGDQFLAKTKQLNLELQDLICQLSREKQAGHHEHEWSDGWQG